MNLFQECSICLERMIFNKTKLLACKHAFHERCIRLAARETCPVCSALILSKAETKTLNGRGDALRVSSNRALPLLKEAVRRKCAPDVIDELLAKCGDLTNVVRYSIAERDANLLGKAVASKTLNWHSTIDDKTIVEKALETNDPDIINVVCVAASRKKLYPSLS